MEGSHDRGPYTPKETQVSYVIGVSRTPDFLDAVYWDTLEVDSVTVVLPEEGYYWQVHAIDDAGNVGLTSVDSFGVDHAGPGAPTLISPTNHDTTSLGALESVTFVWNASTDEISGVESYELYYSDTTVLCFAPETSYVMTPYPLTDLVWRVRACDVAGNMGPWSEEWSLTVLAIQEDRLSQESPQNLALSRCWPNPARDEMTIEYHVPRKARVKVKVFDVSGRLLEVLVDEVIPASVRRTEWKGRDGTGAPVSAGVYTIALEADGRIVTWKVLRLE